MRNPNRQEPSLRDEHVKFHVHPNIQPVSNRLPNPSWVSLILAGHNPRRGVPPAAALRCASGSQTKKDYADASGDGEGDDVGVGSTKGLLGQRGRKKRVEGDGCGDGHVRRCGV